MKKILISILFASFCFVANAQQFGDFEVVCWDSSGVTTTLVKRTSTSNTTGKPIYTFYRLNYAAGDLTTKKVVPTVGTLGACGLTQLQANLLDNDTIINLLEVVVDNTGGSPCQVLNEWRVESLTSNTTFSTNTYHSIAILATSGTVTVSVDGGAAVPLAVGTTITVKAKTCNYVQSPVTVGVTGGAATVTRLF
jgi:hypothetical protein